MSSKRGSLVLTNVGGGYADSGLSDEALVWMVARALERVGEESER
jgi:hypothetical protein